MGCGGLGREGGWPIHALFSVGELLELNITTPPWYAEDRVLTFWVADPPHPRGVGRTQIQDRSKGRPPAV
jgi:hypothetical protein